MEYRIAFFTVDWNYELVESTLHGLKQFVDDHENVRLSVFDCFGKDVPTAGCKSEYAVYNLADLSSFDGVLVQGNQIVLEEARTQLGRRIRAAGIPAVTIDCPIEGCVLVGIDNRLAQEEMVEHVIAAHGARKLVYLTGIIDNGCPEAQDRLDGFLDACRRYEIPEENIQIVYGTWRTQDGIDLVREWMESGRPLPDAFVAANDEMAFGIMEGLGQHGVKIPEDVIVTGFDKISSAELSAPRLSTVKRDYAKLNYRAMEVLLELIDGTEPSETALRHSLVCTESCGCPAPSGMDYLRPQFYNQTRFLKNFYITQDHMAEEMFEAADLPELLRIVERNSQVFGCEGTYLCVNDYYYDNYDKKQWQHNSETFGERMVLATRGASDLTMDSRGQYGRFRTRDLLPRQVMDTKRFWMFYPLHYNTYSIGYLAMDGISESAKLNLHESILSFLEIAIENVRKKCLLRQLNNVLDDLYVRDSLTGVYNRFGFKRFGQEVFDSFQAEEGSAQVLFIDMDDMKGINDRYGHESGDAAICATAEILRRVCGRRAFIMRYGGDEFLAIASGRMTDLTDKILQAVDDYNAAHHLFRLGLSVGSVSADKNEERTLEDCVQFADSLMYDIKAQRKIRRSGYAGDKRRNAETRDYLQNFFKEETDDEKAADFCAGDAAAGDGGGLRHGVHHGRHLSDGV